MRKSGKRFLTLKAIKLITGGKSVSYRAVYEDGWWYQVSLDVSCLELQTAPMTLGYAEEQKARLQTDIFEVADELGLHADVLAGGGHIHFGAERTFGDGKEGAALLRDFMVDLYNHPLAMEVFDNDFVNAPVLGQLPLECRRAFVDVIRQFDEGKLYADTEGELGHLSGLVSSIRTDVYTRENREPPSGIPRKYQAVNLEHFDDEPSTRTVEIRSMRAQRSAHEFLQIARVFQRRLTHLRAQRRSTGKGPVPRDPEAVERGQAASDREAIIAEFKEFLAGANLAYTDYEELVEANLNERKD
jgi:hypothetical protein